jgi:hypothetical protein
VPAGSLFGSAVSVGVNPSSGGSRQGRGKGPATRAHWEKPKFIDYALSEEDAKYLTDTLHKKHGHNASREFVAYLQSFLTGRNQNEGYRLIERMKDKVNDFFAFLEKSGLVTAGTRDSMTSPGQHEHKNKWILEHEAVILGQLVDRMRLNR